jgi:hypothetical protein
VCSQTAPIQQAIPIPDPNADVTHPEHLSLVPYDATFAATSSHAAQTPAAVDDTRAIEQDIPKEIMIGGELYIHSSMTERGAAVKVSCLYCY